VRFNLAFNGDGAGVGSFFSGLQKFGLGRLMTILGIAAGVAGVLAAVFLNFAAQPKALLFSNLDLKEAGEISLALEQAGIKHEVKGDGSTIMVNRDEVATARMMLASKGLPTAASVGYEIFDNAPALGQTEFVQNLNNQRALEGELARTIRSIRGITSARVLLVMPKRELFDDAAQQPTASVVLGIAGGDFNAEQVRAIRNLVASAVPNLKPDKVTVVDDRNRLLAAAGEEEAMSGAGAAHKSDMEESLRKRVKEIVEGVVGAGAARVTVTADLDKTSTTRESVEYNPDGQVVRSTQTAESNDRSTEADPNGVTTAAANIPGGAQTPGVTGSGTQSGTTSETTNYEISTTKTTTVTGPGDIRKLAVSVAVDDIVTPSADGKAPDTYAKRSAEDMQKIAKAPLMDFDKNDIMRGAEIAVLLVVALLTLFFVAKPLMKFINSGPTTYLSAANGGAQLAMAGGAAGMPQVAATAAGGAPPLSAPSTAMAPHSEAEQRIDIARIEGQVKASSVKKVSEFVDRHPEESVSILRSWLHDS
jgi:flagellar M-ring protein FliF